MLIDMNFTYATDFTDPTGSCLSGKVYTSWQMQRSMLMQAFKQTQNSDLFDQWRTCWSQSGAEVNGDLAIAERDLEGARAQQIADGMLATVVINDQHYRGELDAVRTV